MYFKSRLDEIIFDGLRVCDGIIVLLTAFIAYFVRHGTLMLPNYYIIGVVLSSVVFIIAAQGVGVYTVRVNLSQVRCMLGLLIALLLTAVIYLSFLFVIKSSDEISRLWLFYWIGISFIILNLLHMSFIRWLKKRVYSGSFQRTAVLYANADQAQTYLDFFKGRKEFEIKVVVNHEAELKKYCQLNHVDDVILTTEVDKKTLLSLPCDISYCLPLGLLFSKEDGLPIVPLCRRPMLGRNQFIKRAEDLILGSLVFLLILPLQLLIIVVLLLSGERHIFFKQKRGGFYGQAFTVYKFRTMRHHEEQPGVITQATNKDPRVTRIGAILRKYSLDELPQIINVLKGDMSLVGPRPHVLEHDDHYTQLIDSYVGRHRMKPGITGWAQINGWRGETDTLDKMFRRVEYDMHYVENWSLWLDIKILFLTAAVFLPFKNQNAY